MSRTRLAGWIITAAGVILWTYGYIVPGHAAFIDWKSLAPGWISGYLFNAETEIGILLMFAAMVPLYWPQKHD